MKSYKQVKSSSGSVATNCIQLTRENGVISFIPNDPANLDWQEYQEWLAQGNEPDPAD